MKTARHFGVLSLLLMMALGLCTACGSSSDSDDDGPAMGDFTEQDLVANASGTGMVSDFQLSDIEVMEEYTVKMKLMKQQFMRYMSDGYQGSDLMCGPGEHSDATKLFELQTELLENLNRYRPVLERLEQQGTYTTPTTRGLPASFLDFWNALSGSAQVSMDAIRKTMDKGKLWSNEKAQQELFNSLTTSQRDGETNYRAWFNRLNGNDQKLVYKAPQIHLNWLTTGASASQGGGISQYYDAAVKSGTDNIAERVYQMGKDLSEKGGQLMVDLIDKASGGGVSTVTDFIEAVEEEAALVEFIYKVTKGEFKNISKEDIKRALKHYTADKLRDNLPDDISSSDFANDVFNDLMDYIHDTILQDDKDGDAAKEVGKTQLKIENNTGKKIKTVIAQNNNSGKIVYVRPDNSGATIVTVGEGTVTVTVITEDGQRSTQTVSADKAGGLKELQGVPYVREAQLGVNPTELEFDATLDRVGQKVNVTTNCAYMAAKPSATWLTAKLTKDGVMTVTVEENTEDDERNATIRIAALNEQKKVEKSFTLKVKQKSKNDVSFATEISSLTVYAELPVSNVSSTSYGETKTRQEKYTITGNFANSGTTTTSLGEKWENKDRFIVTYPGSKIHVECIHKSYLEGISSPDAPNYSISFDIVGITPPFKADKASIQKYFANSRIENLEFTKDHYLEKYDRFGEITNYRGIQQGAGSFSATDIPWREVYAGAWWDGTVGTGVKISEWGYWFEEINEEEHNTSRLTYEYVANKNNRVSVMFRFKNTPR